MEGLLQIHVDKPQGLINALDHEETNHVLL